MEHFSKVNLSGNRTYVTLINKINKMSVPFINITLSFGKKDTLLYLRHIIVLL